MGCTQSSHNVNNVHHYKFLNHFYQPVDYVCLIDGFTQKHINIIKQYTQNIFNISFQTKQSFKHQSQTQLRILMYSSDYIGQLLKIKQINKIYVFGQQKNIDNDIIEYIKRLDQDMMYLLLNEYGKKLSKREYSILMNRQDGQVHKRVINDVLGQSMNEYMLQVSRFYDDYDIINEKKVQQIRKIDLNIILDWYRQIREEYVYLSSLIRSVNKELCKSIRLPLNILYECCINNKDNKEYNNQYYMILKRQQKQIKILQQNKCKFVYICGFLIVNKQKPIYNSQKQILLCIEMGQKIDEQDYGYIDLQLYIHRKQLMINIMNLLFVKSFYQNQIHLVYNRRQEQIVQLQEEQIQQEIKDIWNIQPYKPQISNIYIITNHAQIVSPSSVILKYTTNIISQIQSIIKQQPSSIIFIVIQHILPNIIQLLTYTQIKYIFISNQQQQQQSNIIYASLQQIYDKINRYLEHTKYKNNIPHFICRQQNIKYILHGLLIFIDEQLAKQDYKNIKQQSQQICSVQSIRMMNRIIQYSNKIQIISGIRYGFKYLYEYISGRCQKDSELQCYYSGWLDEQYILMLSNNKYIQIMGFWICDMVINREWCANSVIRIKGKMDYIKKGKQIIFNVFSKFKVMSIHKLDNNRYQIQLLYVDQNHKNTTQYYPILYFDQYSSQKISQIKYQLSIFYITMQYHLAIKYYLLYRNPQLLIIYQVASSYYNIQQYSNALSILPQIKMQDELSIEINILRVQIYGKMNKIQIQQCFRIYNRCKQMGYKQGLKKICIFLGQYNNLRQSLRWYIQYQDIDCMNIELRKVYLRMGEIYVKLGEIDNSLKYYIKYEKLMILLYGESKQLSEIEFQIGKLYYIKKQYYKGLQMLHKSLQIQNKLEIHNTTHILYFIAQIYRIINQLESSLNYYTKVFNFIQKYNHTQAFQYQIICNIAQIYQSKLQYQSALQNYQLLLQINTKLQTSLIPINHFNIIKSIAKIYKISLRFEQALQYYSKAIKLSVQLYGQNNQYQKNIQNQITQIYKIKSKMKNQIDQNQKCLKLKMQNLDKNHISIGLSYYNMGMIYKRGGELKQACNNFELCYKIYVQKIGQNDIRTKDCLNNLKECRKDTKNRQ